MSLFLGIAIVLGNLGGPTDALSPALVLPSQFTTFWQTVAGGRIDWTHGVIVVEGKGLSRGEKPQARQMAERAAYVVASRNAVAASAGVRIDGDGRVAQVRNGSIRVQGTLRGQQVTSTKWYPNRKPPECRIKMRVPLWGVDGVATVMLAQRGGGSVRKVVDGGAAVEHSIIIDARGLGCRPCLLPRVMGSDHRIVLDVSDSTATGEPPVRYVQSRASYKELSDDGSQSSVIRAVAVSGADRADLLVDDDGAHQLAKSREAHSAIYIVLDMPDPIPATAGK